MPMIKRLVEPVNLSRGRIDQGIKNELECVTNNTLANVIRQLSSLSKHAEDMFQELLVEANNVFERANTVQSRVTKLTEKVARLDATVEDVSLQDINMRKPFKSSIHREQQIITQQTRPASIQDVYSQCDPPPSLGKLNKFREDGKDSMKFYTDPNYFFELWRQGMQSEMESKTKNRKGNRQKKPEKKRHEPLKQVIPIAQRYQDLARGQEFVPTNRPQEPTPERPKQLPVVDANNYLPGQYTGTYEADAQPANSVGTPSVPQSPGRSSMSVGRDRGSMPPPPPPPPTDSGNDGPYHSNRTGRRSPEKLPPPPTPPPPPSPYVLPAPPSPPAERAEPYVAVAPPLPPPLPPPAPPISGYSAGPLPPPPPPVMPSPPHYHAESPPHRHEVGPRRSQEDIVAVAHKPADGRSDLLAAIREGMKLRNVEVQEQKRPQASGALDVQTIMERAFEMRRKAMEDDSDDDSEAGDWSDDSS